MTTTESIKLRSRILEIVQRWEACGIENCDHCNGNVDMILDVIADALPTERPHKHDGIPMITGEAKRGCS